MSDDDWTLERDLVWAVEKATSLFDRMKAVREVLARSKPPAASDLRERADAFCVEVAELPNRTSPDEYPDMLLVTADELHKLLMIEFAAIRAEAKVEGWEGWKEATIAWEVCASLHRKFAKGKDALFTTRQGDLVKHAENARQRLAANRPSPADRSE